MAAFRSRRLASGSRRSPAGRRRWSRRSIRLAWTVSLASLFAGTMVFVGVLRPRNAEAPYIPGERTEGITRSLEGEAPASGPQARFTDVAEAAGAAFHHFRGSRSVQLPEDMGSGVAWGDYDGDGDDDLVAVNIAGSLAGRSKWDESSAVTRLFRNDGTGRFDDVTEAAGTGFRGVGMAASWADYDGDADLDLLITAFDDLALYRNEAGRFSEVTAEAGLARSGFFSGSSWSDYDRDGDLDLYLCRYVQYTASPGNEGPATRQYNAIVPFTLNPSSYPPAPNVLYRNDGNGRFTDVTAEAGVANSSGRSLSAVWSDLDEDGWPDLYVANDVSDNALYLNRRDGTFADRSAEAWVADPRGAMGLAVGDPDNDGDTDLFVTHWIAQENALYRNLLGELPPGKDGRPPLGFIDEADLKGLGQSTLDTIGWGTAFLDFDLDGWQDLFMANGSTFQDERTPPDLIPMRQQLFWNSEGKRFFEVDSRSSPFLRRELVGRGAAVSDYDRDGDPDIAVNVHAGPLVLLRNDAQRGRHFLRVRLEASGENRFAIGAKLRLDAGGRRQTRLVSAGGSYLSQDSLTALFGLGSAVEVDRLEVDWPDGRREEFGGSPVDREVRLIEGTGRPVPQREAQPSQVQK